MIELDVAREQMNNNDARTVVLGANYGISYGRGCLEVVDHIDVGGFTGVLVFVLIFVLSFIYGYTLSSRTF
jgi:hypothetical protein